MKTIFVTSFEGVETKNVLRSSIFSTILENQDTRVIIFTKDPERAAYHKKEFGESERILYEVAPQISIRGLDLFFQWLKFALLCTKTTDLRRLVRFKSQKGVWRYFRYWFGLLVNRLIAHKYFLRLARRLDYYLVANHAYDGFFERYKPDLVFLANIFFEPEVHFLRAAKHYGVKNIAFINSWDKVTARCVLRLLPDKLVVFNDIVKDEVIRYDDVREEDIFVGGIPQYDIYFRPEVSVRETFCRRFGLDPKKKFIVYAPHGSSYSDSDWDIIDLLYSLNREGSFGKDVEILVRFHPYDVVDKTEIKKRPYLKYDYSGVRFSSKIAYYQRGDDWDMDISELSRLRDALYHMSLLICYASSLSIDAAIFDRPVLNINFELKPESLFRYFRQYSQIAHYKKVLDTGGVRLVASPEELLSAAKHYLENPSLDSPGRKRLVQEQCKFTDGKSGERIGKYILQFV